MQWVVFTPPELTTTKESDMTQTNNTQTFYFDNVTIVSEGERICYIDEMQNGGFMFSRVAYSKHQSVNAAWDTVKGVKYESLDAAQEAFTEAEAAARYIAKDLAVDLEMTADVWQDGEHHYRIGGQKCNRIPDEDCVWHYMETQPSMEAAQARIAEMYAVREQKPQDTTDTKKLLLITTDEELIAVRGAEAHQAVKQRTQFWTQPGGYQDVVLDGFVIAEITNGKIAFEQKQQDKEAMQNVADLLHNTKHESSRQACRRFMAALIHFGA